MSPPAVLRPNHRVICASLKPTPCTPHLCPIGQQLRGVLLKSCVRKRTFLPPSSSVFDAAKGPQGDDGNNHTGDTCVDTNLGPVGKPGPTLSRGYRRWGGEGFGDGGVAAERFLVRPRGWVWGELTRQCQCFARCLSCHRTCIPHPSSSP